MMERAVALARQCVSEPGRVSPKVGAVVARDGVVLGEAFRGEFAPGNHAEYTLLERKLGSAMLVGATLFTTLEPCTSRNNPKVPCAERIIEHRIARVVIGQLDPNDAIRGRGQLRLRDAGIEVGLFDPDLMAQIEELNREFTRDQVGARHLERTQAQTADAADLDEVGPNSQAIGQIGRAGVVFGPNTSLPNAVFNLGSEKDRDRNSRSAQAEQYHGLPPTRSDETPPKLKARLVPFEEPSRQYAHRLEVKIVSSEPLMNIVVILPYGDRRLMSGGNWLQARHFGDSLLQPGRWLPFEGLVYLTAQTFTGKIEATANCRSEYGKRWDNRLIKIAFAELDK